MTQAEFYQKTDEIIAKFKNGKKRYYRSATFNRVVQMLARGADTFEIIDQLVTITDDTVKAFEQYIHKAYNPEFSKNDMLNFGCYCHKRIADRSGHEPDEQTFKDWQCTQQNSESTKTKTDE